PVVINDLDSLCIEGIVEMLSGSFLSLVGEVHNDNDNLIRRNADRPDDPVVIVVRFHSGRHRTANPQSVAAHDDVDVLAGRHLNLSAHGVAVLGTQFKDVAHFYTVGVRVMTRAASLTAAIACDRNADIQPGSGFEIDPRYDTGPMGVVLVCAHDHSSRSRQLAVYQDVYILQSDR